jgi:hypothetical protein
MPHELAVDVAFTNEIVLPRRKNLVNLTSVNAIALENERVV